MSNQKKLLIFISIVSVMFVFAFSLVMVVGANPIAAFQSFFYGAFGNVNNLSETFVKASPLLIVSSGVIVAFRSRFTNLGAEGQIQAGAAFATFLGISLGGVPSVLLIPALLLGGFSIGALAALVPGVLKTKLKVNEILACIMMNFIIDFFVAYLLREPLRDPAAEGYPQSFFIATSARLPILVPGTRLSVSILLGLFFAVATYFLLFRTSLGYQIRAVGANPTASHAAGLNVNRLILVAVIISGGLAGLAGGAEISGIHYRLIPGVSGGYGWAGIVTAYLAVLHPLWAILSCILFGGLIVGVEAMRRAVGVPNSLLLVIESLMIVAVLTSTFLMNYQIRRRR